jgi:hypothetical protein
MPGLERAAWLYPYNHDYRLGPARLVVLNNTWTDPKQAIVLLTAVLKNDPNSHYLKNWIAEFNKRIPHKEN